MCLPKNEVPSSTNPFTSLDISYIERDQSPDRGVQHRQFNKEGPLMERRQIPSAARTPQLANDALSEIFELSKDIQVRTDPLKLHQHTDRMLVRRWRIF